ncbi:D-aminoacylase [Aspergillus terreus]|uniref:D-aminoacylase n=1 Tax=Aspergillus terreus TaxID=33178 RepID=A0A5M3Z973_ASPTE|nr:hypothetical protein ATETN484_0012010500 [Aspergillus terreus]GFF19353.1 D-aminoacylase [Aspergillus terreus]
MTITVLLCHRTGIAWGDNLFVGTGNNILVSGDDAMYLNSQRRLLPFRGQFSYSNVAFELAGKVIESLSDESYFDFIQKHDQTARLITCIKAGDDWFSGPSAGMRSCVRDLLKLYSAFLLGFNDQLNSGTTSTEGIPLKQGPQLLTAKIPLDQPSRNKTSYGLGWVRVQTPGRMSQIGLNQDPVPQMLLVGKGVPSQLLIFHQGSLPGVLAANILLPETETAIVVTSNSLALNDVPDWVVQLILKEVIDVPKDQRNDYIHLAEVSRAKSLEWYPRPSIVISLEGGKLYWLLQGLETERFSLQHYEHDTFTWLQPRNELSRRGRWVGGDQGSEFWKVEFKTSQEETIERLSWLHDNGVPAVEYHNE